MPCGKHPVISSQEKLPAYMKLVYIYIGEENGRNLFYFFYFLFLLLLLLNEVTEELGLGW